MGLDWNSDKKSPPSGSPAPAPPPPQAEAPPTQTGGGPPTASRQQGPPSSPARPPTKGPPAPAAAPAAPPKTGSPPAFMYGAEAEEELAKAKRRAEQRREQAGSTFRFWIGKNGGTRVLTFLDGRLNDRKILAIPYFYEHDVPWEGRRAQFRCVRKTEPCPLCEAGDEPYYAGALTVLEWTPWTDREGKEHEYARRLYIPKIQVLQRLQLRAQNYGESGLEGLTFAVSRSSPRDARTGSDFDLRQQNTLEEIASWLEKPEHAKPCDYVNEPELKVLSADAMAQMGIGKVPPAIGAKQRSTSGDLASNLGD